MFLNLGGIPYQECKELEVTELVNQIKKGYRLSKPDWTPDDRYVVTKSLKLSDHLLIYRKG